MTAHPFFEQDHADELEHGDDFHIQERMPRGALPSDTISFAIDGKSPTPKLDIPLVAQLSDRVHELEQELLAAKSDRSKADEVTVIIGPTPGVETLDADAAKARGYPVFDSQLVLKVTDEARTVDRLRDQVRALEDENDRLTLKARQHEIAESVASGRARVSEQRELAMCETLTHAQRRGSELHDALVAAKIVDAFNRNGLSHEPLTWQLVQLGAAVVRSKETDPDPMNFNSLVAGVGLMAIAKAKPEVSADELRKLYLEIAVTALRGAFAE